MIKFQDVRAAARPFVARSLRGFRGRRFGVLSAVFAALAMLIGTWLALGPGEFERDCREGLGVEQSRWEREQAEFVVIADDHEQYYQELLWAETVRDGGGEAYMGEVGWTVERAIGALTAATAVESPQRHRDLAQRAEALLQRSGRGPEHVRSFAWHSDRDVEFLRQVVDQDLVPRVELYTSPLGFLGTLVVIGLLAGGGLGVLLLVVAPLLAGVQLAQETHENTLQPLSGTALTPRQLVLGMTAAPLVVVGILAAPLSGVFVLTAGIAGRLLPALGFLVVAVAGSLMLSAGTQLVGQAAGKRRTPGIIGIGLTMLLTMTLFVGLGSGLNLDHDTYGLVGLLPQTAAFHLLKQTLVPGAALAPGIAGLTDAVLIVGTVVFLTLTAIGLRAIERRITGKTIAPITRLEGFVAAAAVIVSTFLVVPLEAYAAREFGLNGAQLYLISLAIALVPLMVVIAGRVPLGEVPASMRTVPLTTLMLEFFGYLGLHGLVVLFASCATEQVGVFNAIGLLHLAWLLPVAGLLAVRATAVPLRLPTMVWLVLCFVFGVVEFVSAAVGINGDSNAMFILSEVSPILGAIQLTLLFIVPASLVRALQKQTAGIR